jgi:hypothetical protein
MERVLAVESEIFLDAVYAVAISSPDDQCHEDALVLADQVEAAHVRLRNGASRTASRSG